MQLELNRQPRFILVFHPIRCNLHQSAMLVGMAKNSSLYNPVRRPELVLQRRNVVLNQMAKYGYITQEVKEIRLNNYRLIWNIIK